MKKIFLIFFLLFQSNFGILFANTNIVFIDMEKVISTSKPGLSIILQLKQINKKNIKVFKIQKNELKLKEDKIVSQKNIISEKEFQNRIAELKIEVNKYNKNRKEIIRTFNNLKINNTKKFLNLINPILSTYSKDKSISFILQKKNLIIGKTELDITSEIIMIINKDIKEFKIK